MFKKKLKRLKRGIKQFQNLPVKPIRFLLSHIDGISVNPKTKEVMIKFKKEF